MDDLINQLIEVRAAIQSQERFAPTERNCNLILASIQRLNAVIIELSKIKEAAKNDSKTSVSDGQAAD